jgi:hypothetical protein
MNARPGLRRVAVKLVRHAGLMLPGASPWAQAMRREIDYIDDDRAALGWALGCILASYKTRLAAPRTREILRHATAGGALMLVVALAVLEISGGQAAPAPSPPVVDETACDVTDKAPGADQKPDRPPSSPVRDANDAGRPSPETPCARPRAPVHAVPNYETRWNTTRRP